MEKSRDPHKIIFVVKVYRYGYRIIVYLTALRHFVNGRHDYPL